MGSIVFRNRYWFYKSLYDDYLGRDFKLGFGISCLLWMPHYWYSTRYKGWESPLTEQSRRAQRIRTTSSSITLAETALLTVSSSKSSKWSLRIGINSNANTSSVRYHLSRWWKTQLATTCLIINLIPIPEHIQCPYPKISKSSRIKVAPYA